MGLNSNHVQRENGVNVISSSSAVISLSGAKAILQRLSSGSVFFVRVSTERLFVGAARISLSADTLFLSPSPLIAEPFRLDMEGTAFQPTTPMFGFSDEELHGVPLGNRFSQGLLIKFPGNSLRLFIAPSS
jgi:hypothetical protein